MKRTKQKPVIWHNTVKRPAKAIKRESQFVEGFIAGAFLTLIFCYIIQTIF